MSVLTDYHRQVRISSGGLEAEVDEGLAETILALWRAGFETSFSCEGQGLLEDGRYEAPYVVFKLNYRGQDWEIQEVLAAQGWVVLDVASWESPAHPWVPTRTVARFIRPGTVI